MNLLLTVIENRALLSAIQFQDLEDAEALLEEGIDPKSRTEKGASRPNGGLEEATLQLHILARPDINMPLCITAVCLAPYDTILDVMASAMHQRRAWGLSSTPVLGIAFDPHSTCLQTLWGWFEDQDPAEDSCMVCRFCFSHSSSG